MSDSINDEVQVLTAQEKIKIVNKFIEFLNYLLDSERDLRNRENLFHGIAECGVILGKISKNPESYPTFEVHMYGTQTIIKLW